MARILRQLRVERLAFLGLFTIEPNYDVIDPSDDVDEPPKAGLDGLRRVFLPGKYGDLSAEFTTLIHMTTSSTLLGAGFGAMMYSRDAFAKFIEQNDATKFPNHLEAKRQLQHRVTLAMGKGAWKWGFRIGMFSTIFLTTSTAVAAWRGEDGIIEYVIAGMTAGGAFKMNLGLKGFTSGTIIGALVGTLVGFFFDGVFWISGTSMRTIQETQKKITELRDDVMREQREEQLKKEYDLIKQVDVKKSEDADKSA